jgi:hypothetical protein
MSFRPAPILYAPGTPFFSPPYRPCPFCICLEEKDKAQLLLMSFCNIAELINIEYQLMCLESATKKHKIFMILFVLDPCALLDVNISQPLEFYISIIIF